MNILALLTPKIQTLYLESDCTFRQALEKFDFHKFSVVPLIDENGYFVTTISEGDLLRHIKKCDEFSLDMANKIHILDVERYRPYKALDISTDYQTIVELSLSQNFVPIVDDRGVYIGIIRRKDVIRSLQKWLLTNSFVYGKI